jgi:hypothetical protein
MLTYVDAVYDKSIYISPCCFSGREQRDTLVSVLENLQPGDGFDCVETEVTQYMRLHHGHCSQDGWMFLLFVPTFSRRACFSAL